METQPISLTKRKIYKSFFVALLFSAWVFGLYEFRHHQNTIDNFQFFYLQRYGERIASALAAMRSDEGQSPAAATEQPPAAVVESALPAAAEKSFPYYDNMETDAGWIAVSGSAVVSDRALRISSSGFAVLDRTSAWQDYEYSARVSVPSESSVSLISRYTDRANYASCFFSNGYFALRQTIAGKTATLLEWRSSYTLGDASLLMMNVQGSALSCYLDGKLVGQSGRLEPLLRQGSIGIALEQTPNASDELAVQELWAK